MSASKFKFPPLEAPPAASTMFSLRAPICLLDRLDALANATDRTRSAVTILLLQLALDEAMGANEVEEPTSRGAEGFSQTLWLAKVASYGHCCAYCQAPGGLSRDHVTPQRSRGSLDISNTVPCCKPCNSSKGDRALWLEWTPENPSPTLLREFPPPSSPP